MEAVILLLGIQCSLTEEEAPVIQSLLGLMELHPILSSKGMNSPSTQFVTPSRFGIYEPIHQIRTWWENFKSNGNPNTSTPMIVEVDTKLDTQVQTIDIYSTSSDGREVEHSYLPTSTNNKQVNLWIRKGLNNWRGI